MLPEYNIGDKLNDMHLSAADILLSKNDYQRREYIACVVGWLYLAEQDGLLLSTDLAQQADDFSRQVTKRTQKRNELITDDQINEADHILTEILKLQGYNRLEV